MKLVDFNPRWVARTNGDRFGFSFLCPCCQKIRLVVDRAKWSVIGEDWDTLTVLPSIDAAASGHWHGNIERGILKAAK